MTKIHSAYVCRQCGGRLSRWMGRCPTCGTWDSLEEVVDRVMSPPSSSSRCGPPRTVEEIAADSEERLPVSMVELGRVLGGGIVPGSVVLVSGDPGVGKSTLLMQLADLLGREGRRALYVSGEESLKQIGLRARRLGLGGPQLLLLAETDVSRLLEVAASTGPAVLVVDSIQSASDPEVEGPPGSVNQVRHCALRLLNFAKESGAAVFLVGHVTKEGTVAGPKVLEHMVDAVLYLEGEKFQSYRLLRGVKNRFGPSHEVGVFEMRGEGMVEVTNPSAAFLSERPDSASGSAVVVSLEGTRPLLMEVQALVARSPLAVPRRTATGVDYNRLLVLTAVLSRRLGMPLHDQDIYVNVVAGFKIEDPSADLGVCLAIASSLRDSPLGQGTVALGEVGLGGELRSVPQVDLRLREAAKLGFKRAVLSRAAARAARGQAEVELLPAGGVAEAARLAFGP